MQKHGRIKCKGRFGRGAHLDLAVASEGLRVGREAGCVPAIVAGELTWKKRMHEISAWLAHAPDAATQRRWQNMPAIDHSQLSAGPSGTAGQRGTPFAGRRGSAAQQRMMKEAMREKASVCGGCTWDKVAG